MKKFVMAALMAVMMAAPAFAAPEAYSVDVNKVLNRSGSQGQQMQNEDQPSRQAWRERGQMQGQQGQAQGGMMQASSGQSASECMDACSNRQCMVRCMKQAARQECDQNERCSKMMKASGKPMKKGAAQKKMEQQEAPAASSSEGSAPQGSSSGSEGQQPAQNQ